MVTPYTNGTSDELQPFSIILEKKKAMGLETEDKLFLLETRLREENLTKWVGENQSHRKENQGLGTTVSIWGHVSMGVIQHGLRL